METIIEASVAEQKSDFTGGRVRVTVTAIILNYA